MIDATLLSRLLEKYNVPVPRYTSYPTVPFWHSLDELDTWKEKIGAAINEANRGEGISLYIHLPFCESLCTYCGCNKKITTHHEVEEVYLQAIANEWKLYRELSGQQPLVRELHLGGGTPTFFSPANLEALIDTILRHSLLHPEYEFGFEGHPNNTTTDHLQTLYRLGFRRVSYGVQDHDPEVQRVINRIQPLETVKRAVEDARDTGYTSVNFDLIYGLPLQTMATMEKTIRQSIDLKPDRIAFYSYAHVPWTSKAQRLFDENDLPSPQLKMQLYQLGKKLFMENGYTDIGMDHFALPGDDLYVAWKEGRLHRNFMGYTTQRTSTLLGLGVSSISDAGNAFAQNEKTLHDYYARINGGKLAITRGFFLSQEDLDFRRYILDVSCQGRTRFREENLPLLREFVFPELKNLESDGLLEWNENEMKVSHQGRNFIRNICRAFDLHVWRSEMQSGKRIFSQAV